MQDDSQRQTPASAITFYVFLVTIFCVFVTLDWLGNYRATFGELDSYRVYAGVMDAFENHLPLSGPLVYGYGISRGYFALVNLAAGLAQQPARLAQYLNVITFASAVVGLASLIVIGRQFLGNAGASVSVAVVGIVPIWFFGSLYAHPMWPAIGAFLFALAAASLRRSGSRQTALVCDATTLVALVVAFSMRLDVILMSPMFLGVCVVGNRLSPALMLRFAIIGGLSLAIALVLMHFLPAVAATNTSPVAMLATWHNPKRFVQYFAVAQVRIFRALNPALIIAFVCVVLGSRKRPDLAVLLLTMPTVLLNYLFWIPNPQPERHFLYLVPAFALAVASIVRDEPLAQSNAAPSALRPYWLWIALWIVPVAAILAFMTANVRFLYAAGIPIAFYAMAKQWSALYRRSENAALAKGPAILAVCLLAAVGVTPMKVLFHNPYSTTRPVDEARLAGPLLALPKQDKPILVVADAYIVVSAMLAKNADAKNGAVDHEDALHWSVDVPWLEAETSKNKFVFFIQSWLQEDAARNVLEFARKQPSYFVVDRSIAPDVPLRLAGGEGLSELKLP